MVQEEKIKFLFLLRRSNFWQRLIFLFSFFVFLFIFPVAVDAASMYFSPAAGNFNLGQTFTVGIYVKSTDQAANAFSGTISYPTDLLEATGAGKSGSIMSLWVQEPTVSKAEGLVKFEGIVLNPGYTGGAGKIATITFKAKAAGKAALNFSSGSVLANDGEGTNILSGLGGASFTVGPSQEEPKIEEETPVIEAEKTTVDLPGVPKITSPNFPDQNKWYKENNPQFEWSLPRGTTGVSVALNHIATGNPGTSSDGIFNTQQFTKVDDGVWYFHVRLRKSDGWGSAGHYRAQIDSLPPESFEIIFADGLDQIKTNPIITAKAKDATSGIAYYSVKIDDKEMVQIETKIMEGGNYTLFDLSPGKHSLLIQAYDFAGNYTTATADFVIKTLDAPEITQYSENLKPGDILVIKGKTYPTSEVTLHIEKEDGEVRIIKLNSTVAGKFTFVDEAEVRAGAYKIFAEVTDAGGFKSPSSATVVVSVRQTIFWRVVSRLTQYIALTIPLIAVTAILIIIALYAWKKIIMFKRRLRGDVRSAEEGLHSAFDLLRENIRSQIKLLEKAKTKRELTSEEEKIIRRLKKDLDAAEKMVKKKIKKIRNTLDR